MSSALNKIAVHFAETLKGNLLGLYVHGSLAMGCFHPDKSDIDLMVIVKNKLSSQTMKRVTRMALRLEEALPAARGLEFSIILAEHLDPFVYPTPFEYHYSAHHREKYRADANYVCGGFADADLASQLTVAYERGLTLYGQPLRELCPPIDKRLYAASILHDVEGFGQIMNGGLPPGLTPVYVVLNLCRVLYFMKEGAISSKREGGQWGLGELPQRYSRIIRSCLDEYSGQTEQCDIGDSELMDFVRYMLREIHRYSY
ncbi:Streptomycin 3''-adenylyltransferase [Paenibacillus solanacearum]|uniref:Spectinomycin 9-adenylyltransferase n=1 Tax=Paenibacillus solanacearum TaxID=2048548 RepID=A0A916NLI0_9BACL|nr:aminoglycoside adenylyltransferase domain-containing protein [Paenibacillus solanacearum]CAG7648567.1 Streptomycin 3''-adenylyltransferase [Paenibacillus solanacearum]